MRHLSTIIPLLAILANSCGKPEGATLNGVTNTSGDLFLDGRARVVSIIGSLDAKTIYMKVCDLNQNPEGGTASACTGRLVGTDLARRHLEGSHPQAEIKNLFDAIFSKQITNYDTKQSLPKEIAGQFASLREAAFKEGSFAMPDVFFPSQPAPEYKVDLGVARTNVLASVARELSDLGERLPEEEGKIVKEIGYAFYELDNFTGRSYNDIKIEKTENKPAVQGVAAIKATMTEIDQLSTKVKGEAKERLTKELADVKEAITKGLALRAEFFGN